VIEDVIVITNLSTQDTPICHYHWSSLWDKKWNRNGRGGTVADCDRKVEWQRHAIGSVISSSRRSHLSPSYRSILYLNALCRLVQFTEFHRNSHTTRDTWRAEHYLHKHDELFWLRRWILTVLCFEKFINWFSITWHTSIMVYCCLLWCFLWIWWWCKGETATISVL